jgi:serine phosphatase RsbU (regulator of sigma subunit)
MAPINRRTTRVSRSRTPGGTGRIRRSQTNAARKNDDMPAWIPGAFETDQRFQILAPDKSWWLDPCTGQQVAVGSPWVDSALAYLHQAKPWLSHEPKDVQQLEVLRWVQVVQATIAKEPRMRLFGPQGQGWMNPYSGEFHRQVSLDKGRLTSGALEQIARLLATCAFARSGVMLELDDLRAKGRQQNVGRVTGNYDKPQSERDSQAALVDGEDIDRAKSVQQNMLAELPDIPGYNIAVHYHGHAGVSGDCYEFLRLTDGRQLVFIADVSGHGVQAALVMASLLKSLRWLAREEHDMVQLASRLNDEVKEDLLAGQFVTGAFIALDTTSNIAELLLVGHHPFVLIDPEGEQMVQRLGRKGMALGLVSGALFTRSLQPCEVNLAPGQKLYQFTDGLVEAVNGDYEEFGEERFVGALMLSSHESLDQELTQAVKHVIQFANGDPADDLSIVALCREQQPSSVIVTMGPDGRPRILGDGAAHAGSDQSDASSAADD